jgi:threonyl-tRNA synthetase
MYRVIFRFSQFELVLSTRPSSYMGAEEMWNKAEQTLKRALDEVAGTGESSYRIDEGGGAFYGPKIDLYVQDAHKRKHQLGTVQLDFQLPLRFNLGYTCKDGTSKRPAIIHRAILGSLERFWVR